MVPFAQSAAEFTQSLREIQYSYRQTAQCLLQRMANEEEEEEEEGPISNKHHFQNKIFYDKLAQIAIFLQNTSSFSFLPRGCSVLPTAVSASVISD